MSRVRTATIVAAASLLCGVAASPGAGAAPAAEGFGKDSWWYQAMGLTEAHKQSTGEGVTIAVIDTPIDPTVPELRGQDVTAVTNVCGGKPTGTAAIASHGTTVVVNILGNGKGTNPGEVGVAGIAPDASVRLYAADTDPKPKIQCGPMPERVIAEAISRAVDDGARIITMSFGFADDSDVLRAAVLGAVANGVVVVAAAGDHRDASVLYPAATPGVVAVAAVDRNAKPWVDNVKGNREAFVISAAGVELATGAFDGKTWRSDALVTGTSEAAPVVAGGLALVAAKYPNATGNQLVQHLIHNPGGTRTFGKDLETGYGIMSVTKMLASDPARWPDVNPLVQVPGAQVPGAPTQASQDGSTLGDPVAASRDDDGGGNPVVPLVGGLAALLALAGGAFLLMRRRGIARGGAASG